MDIDDLPIFVINLARDTERRAYMEDVLSAIGLKAEFIAAVDGRALTQEDLEQLDEERALRVYGVNVLPSEIGCYLSHYRLYERIVREDIPYALILEDDLEFEPTFPQILQALLNSANGMWKVVRLTTLRGKVETGEHPKFAGKIVQKLGAGSHLYRLSTHVLGAGAYLISQEGAKIMSDYGRRIFMPIDQTMDRFWENNLVPFVVRPFPAHQRQDFSSSIGERNPNRRHNMPFKVRFQRRVQRLQDSLRKRLFNVFH